MNRGGLILRDVYSYPSEKLAIDTLLPKLMRG